MHHCLTSSVVYSKYEMCTYNKMSLINIYTGDRVVKKNRCFVQHHFMAEPQSGCLHKNVNIELNRTK